MKKKSRYILLAIAVLILVGIGIWKNPAILNSQPILNNESYAPTLANIKTTKDSLKVTRSGQKKLESAFIKTMTNDIFPY